MDECTVSDAKRTDSPEAPWNVIDGFSATTLQNIDELRKKLSNADHFGRPEVVEAIGGSDSRAGKLLKKMLEAGIIERVTGHGKGRYRFRELHVQESGKGERDVR